jgi:hypothetical protein
MKWIVVYFVFKTFVFPCSEKDTRDCYAYARERHRIEFTDQAKMLSWIQETGHEIVSIDYKEK